MFDPRPNIAAIGEAITMLRRHTELVVEMTRRELLDRFAGNALGGLWVIGAPALILATNVFAFMYIMRIRLGTDDTGLQYAIYVLSGMTPWLALCDAIGRAPGSIVGSANLVKQIVFPSEVLPLKLALATFPSLCVGVVVVLSLSIFNGNLTVLGVFVLMPICIVYYFILIMGFVYALAALGVFLRDVRDIVGILLSAGMFLHPIFYPPGAIPHWLEKVFLLSPFSYLIWCFRDALLYGRVSNIWFWIVPPIEGLFFLAVGWRIFRMLRPTFGNAL